MIKSDSPFVVIGAGSIGERHIRNLLALGYTNIHVFRQRNLPLRTVESKQVRIFQDFADIAAIKPVAAFVTSPTSLHLEQTLACIEKGIHTLVEKPLSHTAEGLTQLKESVTKKGVYVHVGYMMRFHPLVQKLKQVISEKTYGKLLSFTTHWGEYLPDWHPWEDYRTSYAARKELGGGAALTLSHDLDLANWLSDAPVRNYYGLKNYASALEVNTEAGADFLIEYQNGITGHVHLNYFEQPAQRYLKYVFENGSADFDYYANRLTFRTKDTVTVEAAVDFDRNQLFIGQTQFFLEKITSFTRNDSLQQIEESEQIIRMCL
jgi:predicted dehydrogenase